MVDLAKSLITAGFAFPDLGRKVFLFDKLGAARFAPPVPGNLFKKAISQPGI